MFEASLSQAVGHGGKKDTYDLASSKLNKVWLVLTFFLFKHLSSCFLLTKVAQLTGFSDPIYAEAYVHVNQFDILLDLLMVNQTDDVLQNVTLELATLGDYRISGLVSARYKMALPLFIMRQAFADTSSLSFHCFHVFFILQEI